MNDPGLCALAEGILDPSKTVLSTLSNVPMLSEFVVATRHVIFTMATTALAKTVWSGEFAISLVATEVNVWDLVVLPCSACGQPSPEP